MSINTSCNKKEYISLLSFPIQKHLCSFLDNTTCSMEMRISKSFQKLILLTVNWKEASNITFSDALHRRKVYGLSVPIYNEEWQKFYSRQRKIYSNILKNNYKIISFGTILGKRPNVVAYTTKYFILVRNEGIFFYNALVKPFQKEKPGQLREIKFFKEEYIRDLKVDASSNILVTCSNVATRIWNLKDTTPSFLCSIEHGNHVLLSDPFILLDYYHLYNYKTNESRKMPFIEYRTRPTIHNKKMIEIGINSIDISCTSLENDSRVFLQSKRKKERVVATAIIADRAIVVDSDYCNQTISTYSLLNGELLKSYSDKQCVYYSLITDHFIFQHENRKLYSINHTSSNAHTDHWQIPEDNQVGFHFYNGNGRLFILKNFYHIQCEFICLDFAFS